MPKIDIMQNLDMMSWINRSYVYSLVNLFFAAFEYVSHFLRDLLFGCNFCPCSEHMISNVQTSPS